MTIRVSIPMPRPDCDIHARGHQPNHIQVLRFAVEQRATAPRVRSIDVTEQSDDLGTIGVYRLGLDDATVTTVFDHDPARCRALLAANPDAELVLTDCGILYIGDYCLSVAPIEQLADRRACGENPWLDWLRDGEGPPPTGGFLMPGPDALAVLRDDQ
jgi:hypothetical protein